jgi:hypothetical protein
VTRCGFASIYHRNLNLHVKKVHGERTTKKIVRKTFPPVQVKIIKSEMAPIAETITGDLDEYESDDSIEILSEVGSAFVGTPSGSSSETLTTATSSEDGFYKGPEIEGPEIALETPPLSRVEGDITPCKNSGSDSAGGDGVLAEVGVAEGRNRFRNFLRPGPVQGGALIPPSSTPSRASISRSTALELSFVLKPMNGHNELHE